METDVTPYQALQAIMGSLGDGDGAFVEFEIISGNRAKYADMLFRLDQVIGYAKDLRLIEYRVEDYYDRDQRKSRKTIYVYRYGTHPDTDERIIKRGKSDPSGHWERFFPEGIQGNLLRSGKSGDSGGKDDQSGSGNNLPSQHPKTGLLG